MNASEKAKAKWQTCAEIAKLVKRTKREVHDYLYYELTKKKLVEEVLSGNLEQVYSLEGWAKLNKIGGNSKEELTTANELKLAMWYISKVGDPLRALVVMKAAVKAMEVCNEGNS